MTAAAPGGIGFDQLHGFRIGVTSDRRSGDLIAALERRGAQVFHAPALKIASNHQDLELVERTSELIHSRPEAVLITTGYGMRRWLEVADTVGLGAGLTAALGQSVIFARGPKAVGAVWAAGLGHAQTIELQTTASMVDEVAAAGLTGRRIAIQLHGYTDEVQLARLRDISPDVVTVTPYRWVQPASHDRLHQLVELTARSHLDAVTFTSAPAALATLEAAESMSLHTAFTSALRGDVMAAAIGPVTAAPLRARGIEAVVPDRYRLGALIGLVCEQLSTNRVERYSAGDLFIEARGHRVIVDGRSQVLGPNALAIFKTLANSSAVVSRAELMDALPEPLDEHALEVAISRLRRSLGVPGLIGTRARRGYRLNATRLT